MTENLNEDKELNQSFQEAKETWKKAQVLHRSPSWNGEPEASAKLEELVKNHPECEKLLHSSLSDENQLIVAYCLIGLEMLNSDLLENLPDGVSHRTDKITIREGSFSNSMDLGGLARQVRKRVKSRLDKP